MRALSVGNANTSALEICSRPDQNRLAVHLALNSFAGLGEEVDGVHRFCSQFSGLSDNRTGDWVLGIPFRTSCQLDEV